MEDRAITKAIQAQRAKARAKANGDGLPWARCGNLLLGIWLQASVVVWPHSDGARVSAWFPGLLISVVALLAMSAPPMRWLNAFLAMWLILWTFVATGSEPLAHINGVACGLLVLLLSAIPSKSAAADHRS